SPRGLNPYPFDYRTAFASSLVLDPPSRRQPPCGGPTPRGGRRAYHVPRMNHGWGRLCLSAGGSTATAGEGGYPGPRPRPDFLILGPIPRGSLSSPSVSRLIRHQSNDQTRISSAKNPTTTNTNHFAKRAYA